MMAWRIAYCKVFYPLAYYAAFFSIRATAFSYELMCQGQEKLEYYMAEYNQRKDTLSKKEQDTYRDMRIVQEMYARGFEFLPMDLYKSDARYFQIVDGSSFRLLPPSTAWGTRRRSLWLWRRRMENSYPRTTCGTGQRSASR